jgi:transposase
LGAHGRQAVMTVKGSTDTDVFRPDVTRGLGLTVTPGASVVMENLQAHNVVGIQQALAQRGARLVYVPPYSPELSPLEPCGSQLKTAWRTAKAHTRGVLAEAIKAALPTITAGEA